MRFFGTIEAKIDSKGRVFLPATKDIFQPCLVLYPASVWNRQTDTLRSRLSRWDATHQAVFRQFVADAEAVTLDANGRFLIMKRHLKAAGINQSVRFIGMDDTIEIWNGEQADTPFMEQEEFGKTLEAIMKTAASGAQPSANDDGAANR